MNISDRDILTLYRKNDHEGIREAFQKYYRVLCIYAHGMTDNMQMAEDIVQSVFIKCWQDQCFLTIKTSLKSFLLVSVRNACINQLKKNARRFLSENQQLEETPITIDEEYLPDPELMHKLDKTIAELPEKCRRVFMMIVTEEKSYKETAALLNISVNTVKTQLSRALTKLRTALKPCLEK